MKFWISDRRSVISCLLKRSLQRMLIMRNCLSCAMSLSILHHFKFMISVWNITFSVSYDIGKKTCRFWKHAIFKLSSTLSVFKRFCIEPQYMFNSLMSRYQKPGEFSQISIVTLSTLNLISNTPSNGNLRCINRRQL